MIADIAVIGDRICQSSAIFTPPQCEIDQTKVVFVVQGFGLPITAMSAITRDDGDSYESPLPR